MVLRSPLDFILWIIEVQIGDHAKFPFGPGIRTRQKVGKLFSSSTLDFSKVKKISTGCNTRVLSVLQAVHYGALRTRAETLQGTSLTGLNVKEPLSVTYMLPKPNHPAVTHGICTNHL